MPEVSVMYYKIVLRKFVILLALTAAIATYAAPPTKTKPGNQPYSLTLLAEYGYNKTWLHYGGAQIKAFLPVNEHVEITLIAEGLSSNVYSAGLNVRPKMALPIGELFFDATVHYSAIQRNRIHDAITATSIGYRMDYVSAQVGCFYRTMASYDRAWHSEEEYLCEPFNFLYRIAANVRPLCSRWNIYMGFANFNETQFERPWQPLFFLGGYYDFAPSSNFEYTYRAASHFRLLFEATCKPTGMFHLNANFYGATAKFGFAYKF